MDSGGPSLPLGQLLPGTSEVARMATLRLFASQSTLGTLDPDRQRRSGTPTPGRLNRWNPGLSGFQAAILLKSSKVAVLGFLRKAGSFSQKV